MYTYLVPSAYEAIQKDIEDSFHRLIGKSKEEIRNICIVGAYHAEELYRLYHTYPNSIFYLFEAHPEHYRVMYSVENGRIFHENSRVKTFNKAVSNKCGEVDFYELDNDGGGCGSLLEPVHDTKSAVKEVIKVPCTTLREELGDIDIDLLWVDVQGAELQVLEGVDTRRCVSMFLEISTSGYEGYLDQCDKEDLEAYLVHHDLHSIGLDQGEVGVGNSFWIRKE